ncbi:hypothetical protein RHA1_ro10238 (plasmid) [Rhodococcus jostii RHA1]|jgi:hypothetical protein|uniref:Uncharacterized protein n=1 Tax=Rhodococcus jostii (strain RHA1) TaxID=101510 RepID=Q0RWA5_RHOJR|nr:hypothetical protein RHA1_ro10238 [Rhodococcus jostii RHA1]
MSDRYWTGPEDRPHEVTAVEGSAVPAGCRCRRRTWRPERGRPFLADREVRLVHVRVGRRYRVRRWVGALTRAAKRPVSARGGMRAGPSMARSGTSVGSSRAKGCPREGGDAGWFVAQPPPPMGISWQGRYTVNVHVVTSGASVIFVSRSVEAQGM